MATSDECEKYHHEMIKPDSLITEVLLYCLFRRMIIQQCLRT